MKALSLHDGRLAPSWLSPATPSFNAMAASTRHSSPPLGENCQDRRRLVLPCLRLLGELDPGLSHLEQERFVGRIARAARQTQAFGGAVLVVLGCRHTAPRLCIHPLTRKRTCGSRQFCDLSQNSWPCACERSQALRNLQSAILIRHLRLIIGLRSHSRGHFLSRQSHSITSSAMASTPGARLRPSAAAVFRLITSSNLVGCSTGRSAGLAPLKTLST